MKGYVVTLMDLPASVEVATRCIESGKQFEIEVELFPAVDKSIAMQELEKEGLNVAKFETSYSNTNAVIGNFVSQYRIWKKIAENNAPSIVLEHDAVFVGTIPELSLQYDIVNLGKPSYGKYDVKDQPGIYPLFSKAPIRPQDIYMPGAHAYYVSPTGATELINNAKSQGILPCDLFLCTSRFPHIQEIWPWPVEAHDSFTTIQHQKGCKAKHNYNNQYEIIN